MKSSYSQLVICVLGLAVVGGGLAVRDTLLADCPTGCDHFMKACGTANKYYVFEWGTVARSPFNDPDSQEGKVGKGSVSRTRKIYTAECECTKKDEGCVPPCEGKINPFAPSELDETWTHDFWSYCGC